jgi:hypothetical protein
MEEAVSAELRAPRNHDSARSRVGFVVSVASTHGKSCPVLPKAGETRTGPKRTGAPRRRERLDRPSNKGLTAVAGWSTLALIRAEGIAHAETRSPQSRPGGRGGTMWLIYPGVCPGRRGIGFNPFHVFYRHGAGGILSRPCLESKWRATGGAHSAADVECPALASCAQHPKAGGAESGRQQRSRRPHTRHGGSRRTGWAGSVCPGGECSRFKQQDHGSASNDGVRKQFHETPGR